MRGTSSSITQTASTGDIGIAGGSITGASAGTFPTQMSSAGGVAPMRDSDANEVSQEMYDAMAKKSSSKKASPPARRDMPKITVVRSPKGHRVKLVGADLVGLAPLFVGWADRLEKDLRVVITQGEAPYQFYGRPMVAQRLGANGVALFLIGRNGRDDSKLVSPNDTPLKWRVGLDEIAAERAPAKLDSPEFPAFTNIVDDKKVFIGRVESKFIYTMLYIPTRVEEVKDIALPADLTMKQATQRVVDTQAIEPFVNHVLTQYERIMAEFGAEIRGELTPLSFKEFCGDSKRKRERTLKEQIDGHNREIRDFEQKLMKKARELRDAQKDLALTRSGAFDAELEAEADRLNRLVDTGLYIQFKVRHGFLVGMTTPIVIDYNGKPYELGQFVVSIKKDGQIKIEHPTKGHPYHPHISSGGSLCLGSFRNDIPKLVGLERYAIVFQVLYEFLGSYNDKDKYNKIEVCTGEQEAPAMAEPGIAVPAGANPMPDGMADPRQVDPRDFEPAEVPAYRSRGISDNERMNANIRNEVNADLRAIERETSDQIARSMAIPPEMLISSRLRTGAEMRMLAEANEVAAPTQPVRPEEGPF